MMAITQDLPMKQLLVALVFLVSAAPAPAADFDPKARADFLAPYLDDQVVFVAHGDLTRVDVDAIVAKAATLLKFDPKELPFGQSVVRGLVAGLCKAKAKDVYVVVSLAYTPNDPAFVLVPLEPGADDKAVLKMLTAAKLVYDGEFAKVGSAIVGAGN